MGITPLPLCPRCRGHRVVQGVVRSSESFRPATQFVPRGLRLFWFVWMRPRVPFMTAVNVCSECGLLWSEVDLESLRRTIETLGKPFLKDRIGLFESLKPGPGADDVA